MTILNRIPKYFIPITFILYGVLVKNGVHIPKVSYGSSNIAITAGIIGIVFYLYIDFFHKQEDKNRIESGTVDGILDFNKLAHYFFNMLFILSVIYFGLYLFKIIKNDVLFVFSLLVFFLYGYRKKIIKFLIKRK